LKDSEGTVRVIRLEMNAKIIDKKDLMHYGVVKISFMAIGNDVRVSGEPCDTSLGSMWVEGRWLATLTWNERLLSSEELSYS